jgi:hypothetical protein
MNELLGSLRAYAHHCKNNHLINQAGALNLLLLLSEVRFKLKEA